MADEAELSNRLQQVRRLLDEAESKRTTVADPVASAQIATQVAIGNAVLVMAERMAKLNELSGISDKIDDLQGTID